MKILKDIKHWYKWNIHTRVRHAFGLIAKTDWIDAYSFMSKKMLPYLYQFRDNEKSGTPIFTSEDEVVKNYEKNGNIFNISGDSGASERMWKWIIDEIIFALEYCVVEDDDDCYVPNPDYNPEQKKCFKDIPQNEDGTYTMEFNKDYGETIIDLNLLKKKHDRVKNGLALMGKYWMNIWD